MSALPPTDWAALKTAFAELAELVPAERSARLAAIAATDPALAERLAELLAADDLADHRLAPFELLSGHGADRPPADDAPVDRLGLVGRTIAQFRVLAVLGSGGMGVAYRAEDTRLGRTVALKFLLPGYALDAEARRRFLYEARTASALDHPNVCTLLEVGDSPYGLFLAMPAYAGETLQQRLAREGRIPMAETVAIVRQVLQGLAAAHAAGITHRDLKPGNLLLTPDGTVKILDFGLARSGDQQLSTPGVLAGTVAYMSPEQLQGGVVDARGDLWAVGILLYELLTGTRPFGSGPDLGALYAIVHDAAPPPSTLNADVPPQLDAIVERLLQKDPDRRYGSAAEVMAALDELSAQATSPAAGASVRRTRPRWALLGALLIVLAGGAAVVPLFRWASARERGGETERASVAVLPFADTSPERNQAHLGEGVAEEILNALITVPGLRVPARSSSFRFRDSAVPVTEQAARLGVANVLEGSVHRAGDQLRITARLLDVRTGRYLWSRTFDRRFRDIFAVQAEIARTVADALEVQLAVASSRPQPTQNVVAYELYLRGLFHWNRRTSPDLRQAIDFFTQATQHDASFALPHAGLALSYVVLSALDPGAVALLPRTHDAAARALALDPALAEAHAAQAYAYHWQWRWQEAEREFQRALALNPNYATAQQWYGEFLAKIGRGREGEAHMRRAIALDPLSLVAQNDLGIVLLLNRRYDESIAQFEHVRRLDPTFPLTLLLLHRVHLMAGHAEEAAEAGRRWAELTGMGDGAELVLLARATHDRALRPEARVVLTRWERESAPRWSEIAFYRTLLDDREEAIGALQRALQARAPMLAQLRAVPWLDPLRDDPRVKAMVQQMGFP